LPYYLSRIIEKATWPIIHFIKTWWWHCQPSLAFPSLR